MDEDQLERLAAEFAVLLDHLKPLLVGELVRAAIRAVPPAPAAVLPFRPKRPH